MIRYRGRRREVPKVRVSHFYEWRFGQISRGMPTFPLSSEDEYRELSQWYTTHFLAS